MQKYLMKFFSLFLVILSLCLGSCTSQAPINPSSGRLSDPKPLTLLVSIDGFKPEYLQRGITPNLQQLAITGAAAQGMLPVFPSITFPNHFSMVTGLYPDHHGIVNNNMKDPEIREPFKLSSRTAVTNPAWWTGGVPIWVSAQQQGLRSSTLFWPGSETTIKGIQPNDWLYYDKNMSASARVSKLLEWLHRPKTERADFATLYFEDVDSMGHRYGPNSNEVNLSLVQVDLAIHQLIMGLKETGLYDQTTLIIVSDHGMAEVPPRNQIRLNQLLSNFSQYSVEWQGPLAGINLNGNSEKLLLNALKQSTYMSCWPKKEIPTQYHFGSNPRIPDVVCLADLGWTIIEGTSLFNIQGQHGFDPQLKEMHGIFIASGYRIHQQRLNTFENIEVYPFLCHLLDIVPEKNDAKDILFRQIVQ